MLATLAAAFVLSAPRDIGGPEEAEAGPTAILGLNSGLCTALGIAFAGFQSVDAINYCNNIDEQSEEFFGIQQFKRCLDAKDVVKKDPDTAEVTPGRDGVRECTQGTDPNDVLYEPGVQQITAADFAALDRDQNQIHAGQSLIVMAFVDDDAPVRFTTNFGQITSVNDSLQGQDYYCETYVPGVAGDPDCDGLSSTQGDGVVVASIIIDNDAEPGTHTVTAVQEGIGFPMEFKVVGKPKTIQLEPLFGKTVISTGATAPTSSLTEDENDNGVIDKLEDPLPTACDFAATASAVLGANSDPEKVIIVAKAFDDDGNEVAGALMKWDFPFTSTDEDVELSDIAGVALPQTPTLDTGPLGIAFPQFLCGKDEPGTFTVRAIFDTVLDPFAKTTEEAELEITVVGPGENISLSADPATVDCNGTNSATVSAIVTTADGDNAANGTDVEWSIATLGTVNPLVSDTTAGKATTVVTPLSGATAGVVVVATVNDEQASILVNCAPGTGTIPPGGGTNPPPTGGTGGSGGRPNITGPDTGSGGDLDGTGSLSIWAAIGLFAGAMGLIGARYAIRRA